MRATSVLNLALGLVGAVMIGGCAGSPPKIPSEFAGLVNVGGVREMYVDWRGAGSPTVVLIAGARGSYDDWTTVIEHGEMKPSRNAVLPQVARFTRVCAYDRPGTTRLDGSQTPTTSVVQPTSAVDGVADLHLPEASVFTAFTIAQVGLALRRELVQVALRVAVEVLDLVERKGRFRVGPLGFGCGAQRHGQCEKDEGFEEGSHRSENCTRFSIALPGSLGLSVSPTTSRCAIDPKHGALPIPRAAPGR